MIADAAHENPWSAYVFSGANLAILIGCPRIFRNGFAPYDWLIARFGKVNSNPGLIKPGSLVWNPAGATVELLEPSTVPTVKAYFPLKLVPA
ncbi:hypothetical protein PSACC_01459 [Paramicrosporidium saccamoebae]|uniref:Uncharacterized protein n=1 Tax=Paramicrosporidium saccamoebae TaxID=1246581 RepID=A0A2H9TLU7_9FUNG|nr:hypothetical protein PSACC_01459 [Paramicrosporidium saccamoebae]